jgi:hypothetical protein
MSEYYDKSNMSFDVEPPDEINIDDLALLRKILNGIQKNRYFETMMLLNRDYSVDLVILAEKIDRMLK